MDALRITWGMPLVVYYDIDDEAVTPKQHIIRALGGPVFNILVLPIAWFFRRFTPAKSVARDIADAAVGTNILLPSIGLLPIPGIDGGPILKWSLVARGHTPESADTIVQKVDGVLGILLACAGVLSFKRRRWWLGGLFVQLAILALSIALGLLKEQE